MGVTYALNTRSNDEKRDTMLDNEREATKNPNPSSQKAFRKMRESVWWNIQIGKVLIEKVDQNFQSPTPCLQEGSHL
jgi:hypothetical protein